MIRRTLCTLVGLGAASLVAALPVSQQRRARHALQELGATPLRWPAACALACVGVGAVVVDGVRRLTR